MTSDVPGRPQRSEGEFFEQSLKPANDGDEMIRGTFASFALAVFSQGGLAHADPSIFDGIIFAQATVPEAQPSPAQGQPQAAPETPKKPGVTQLPPVKVTPEAAREAQPKPRQVQKPRREVPPVRLAQPAAARPLATPVPEATAEAAAEAAALADLAQGVPMSPVKGSDIPLEKVPSSVTTVTSGEISQSRVVTTEEALQLRVPGVVLSDMQGNGFQTSVQYRGFEASPVNGTPQGLAVYQNGVRINEVFGDIVNWDFIPSNAIDKMTVMSGNPIYGLNALGGAIAVKMKDGFGFQGVESDTRFGSFGGLQEAVQVGQLSGNMAAYAAWQGIKDEGWRDFSPSHISRFFGDVGAKPSTDSEFHFNYSAATNFVGVAGLSPQLLLDEGWNKTFTTPQTTVNQMRMASLNGSVGLTDTLQFSGVGYYRQFRQKHVDGNITDASPCTDDETVLCLDDERLRDANGNVATVPSLAEGHVIGEIDRTSAQAHSYGASLQATSKAPVAGHTNQFVFGVSYDHGNAHNTSSAELGDLDTSNFVVKGNGFFPVAPLGISPLNLNTTTDYIGIYTTDTFDVTNRLSITAGARYNYAKIDLNDLNGPAKVAEFGIENGNPDLSGQHLYTRINPTAGGTYKLTPTIILYGNYSEANRAPTPAELACSNPNLPCLMENFLASDPDLKQVVSYTWETGLRGAFAPSGATGKVDWSLGLFRTLATDDIIQELVGNNAIRGAFRNAGDTLRRGVEASASYTTERMQVYATYAVVDATFQSTLTLNSPNNPQNPDPGELYPIIVHPGDQMPGIPEYRIKAGIDYMLTDAWKIGGNLVYFSSQYYVGDENNQNTKVPGYAVVNVHTSYDVNKNFQVYGLINNLFDNKYAYYGTYYDSTSVGDRFGGNLDPRALTPAAPLAVYGGIKIRLPQVTALE